MAPLKMPLTPGSCRTRTRTTDAWWQQQQLQPASVLLLLLLFCLTGSVDSIKCYECDGIDNRVNNCPGWHRRPVDTLLDRHDKGGLFTHCMEIRLGNGTVIHQGPYPARPSCARDFREVWKQTLAQRFRQRVIVRCCDYNMCNGPNGGLAGGQSLSLLWMLLLGTAMATGMTTRLGWGIVAR